MMVLLKASLSWLPRFSKKSNSLFIVVFFSFSEVLWQGCVLVDTVKIPTSKRGLDRFDRSRLCSQTPTAAEPERQSW